MGIDSFNNYECEGQMDLTDYTENRQLTHLSLFSGIGGLDLAAEWAGFKSIGQCEWADYPTKILEKHWPDVSRWRDIRSLNGASFYERTNRRTVDVISGGFPCQPFSTAGKQRGEEDDRYLWPEMARVIKELRPTWVVGENVAGIINMALDTVLSDLETAGYTTRTFLIPACGVNAPHQRYRTAIVAYANGRGQFYRESQINAAKEGKQAQLESRKCSNVMAHTRTVCNATSERLPDRTGKKMGGQGKKEQKPKRSGCNVPDTNNGSGALWGQPRPTVTRTAEGKGDYIGRRKEEHGMREWWTTEPGVGRVANGIPNRVDRIKCLGNAVVPAQFYPIFRAIADIELNQ